MLRVAGVSVKPLSRPSKTVAFVSCFMRHKLSFGGGILYFTADREKNLYGVVASEDYPMAQVFDFLDEMLEADPA